MLVTKGCGLAIKEGVVANIFCMLYVPIHIQDLVQTMRAKIAFL